MKTKKQVLALFCGMQKALFAERGIGADVRTLCESKDGTWVVEILVHKRDESAPDGWAIWELLEWYHYSFQEEKHEEENQRLVAKFKEKYGLK